MIALFETFSEEYQKCSIKSIRSMNNQESTKIWHFHGTDLNSVSAEELDEHTIQGDILLFSYPTN